MRSMYGAVGANPPVRAAGKPRRAIDAEINFILDDLSATASKATRNECSKPMNATRARMQWYGKGARARGSFQKIAPLRHIRIESMTAAERAIYSF